MQAQLSFIGEPVKPTKNGSACFTHREVVEISAKWLGNKCGVVLPEFVTYEAEIPDVLGFRRDHSYMVEVKVSRSDFLRQEEVLPSRREPGRG